MFNTFMALAVGVVGMPATFNPPRIEQTNLQLLFSSELTDYSSNMGSRRQAGVELKRKVGSTTVVGQLQTGSRTAGRDRFRGTGGGLTVSHNWTAAVSTRTTATVATDSPLFPKRSLQQEVSLKVAPGIVLSVAGKSARYYGGVDVNSLSAGTSWYFHGGLVSYRFTHYGADRMGSGNAHLASFRLNDRLGAGSTQLWLGIGSSLVDQNLTPLIQKGSFRSVAIRRVQPVGGNVALSFGLGQDWYKTRVGSFTALRPSLGLVFN